MIDKQIEHAVDYVVKPKYKWLLTLNPRYGTWRLAMLTMNMVISYMVRPQCHKATGWTHAFVDGTNKDIFQTKYIIL